MAENMHAASVGVDGRRGDGSSSSNPPLRRSTSQGYAWEFPGEGEVVRLNFKDKQRQQPSLEEKHAEPLLGELPATAICGNDITSSCLYVCGLCAADAGVYAPLAVCLVIATLYLFRNIYVEVCSALPMNGGTFSVLLHTTTKKIAAAAACMSILSYVATGVVSASEAVNYLSTIWEDCPVEIATVALLGFFAVLNLIGITESAGAAMVIFAVHIATIATLALFAAVYILTHGASPIVESYWSSAQPSFFPAIFYGFGGAMLGVSGFETSAQFIEEQAPGVFAKTLRNMWIAVALINPLLTLEALCIVPVEDIQSKYHLTLLAKIADVSGGAMLRYLVGLDAFLVLSGAVLTSYVGVVGVTRRLALDSCVPEFLLAQNKWRGTNHWIIIGFFLVCCSMLSILQGDTAVLSKVYSVSFLGLMITFCIGNLMLKTKRGKLRRDLHAPVWSVMLGMILVSIGLLSTVVKEPSVIRVFGMYYTCSLLITAVMFSRKQVLKMIYRMVLGMGISEKFSNCCRSTMESFLASLEEEAALVNAKPLIFLTKGYNSHAMNKAVIYISENEDTQYIKFVHFMDTEKKQELPPEIESTVKFLDRIYPKFKIDLVIVEGEFSPANVRFLSRLLDIPRNRMFMACPSTELRQTVASLGGVRVITH